MASALEPFRYNVAVPDINALFEPIMQGLEQRKKDNLVRSIGSRLSSGDYSGARDTAFASGDIGTGLKIHELSLEEKKQFAETVQRYTILADTPDKWEALRGKLTELTGQDPGDFGTGREELLGEFGDLDTILQSNERAEDNARADEQLDISRQHLEIAQEKARAEASGGTNLFGGNGLDAQALNKLVANGTLTEQQALEVAAGKTITGPNGEIIFAAPSALIGASGVPQDAAPSGMTPLTGGRLTEDMRKVQGFADRASASDTIISQEDITAAGLSLAEKASSGVPAVGNYLVSKEYQQFDQARRDFVNALLRRESGAVINPDEFENANKQYFPQPGDGDDVLKQKAANRKRAIDGLRASANPNQTFPSDVVAGPRKPDDVPTGVDPDDWRFMTEEERALWR